MEEKKKLGTGLTVWLWIIFVLNIIMGIVSIFTTIGAPAVAGILGISSGYVALCAVSTVLEIVLIVGIAMMLFGHKKTGFFLMLVVVVIALINNLIMYGMMDALTAGNIVKALISAVVAPLVTFLFAKKDMENGTLA